MSNKFNDLTGMKFNHWTVLYLDKSRTDRRYWICECDCNKHTTKPVSEYNLTHNRSKSCGCAAITNVINANKRKTLDLTGMRFGRLVVIERVEDYISPQGKHFVQWKCLCDCQLKLPEEERNYTIVTTNRLTRGITKSCGCIHKEFVLEMNKNKQKYNKYDLESKEYGIGYTTNLNQIGTNEFWFDKEDYCKIKNYTWRFGGKGEVITNDSVLLHRVIMDVIDSDDKVDHIKHQRYDNRKSQLRVTNNSQNCMNRKIQINNKSGCPGVYYDERIDQYNAYITCNNKRINLGYYNVYEKAVEVRKEAEEKYFGEYSYDNSMSANLEESSENNNE